MVNGIAIVVAAVVMFAIGAAWYTALFGQQWRDLQGIKGGAQPEPTAMAVGFLGTLVEAYVLARIIDWYGAPGLLNGMVVAGVVWVGFVAAIMVPTIYYERKPPMVVAINAGYQLVGLLAMGAILGAWR